VTHLGDRVTPLVDGQLPPDATERAYAHIATCQQCRRLVDAERLMKSRLAALADPQPSGELVERLLSLAGPVGPLPPRTDRVPGTPRVQPVAVAAVAPSRPPAGPDTGSTRPSSTRPARFGRRRSAGARPRSRLRVAATFVGALTIVGVGIAGGVSLTAARPGPSIVPPVDVFVVEHAATTSDLPFVEEPAGWGEVAPAAAKR